MGVARSFLPITFLVLTLLLPANTFEDLQCLVCRAVADEIDTAIKNTNPAKKVQIGGYRLDPNGNQFYTEIPYARSEIHLQEIMESICETVGSEYTRVTHKETGEESLFRFLTSSGKMNPDFSKYDVLPNNDMERNVKFQCEIVIENSEEHIMTVFKNETESPAQELCWNLAGYCKTPKDEDEGYDEL